VGWKGGRRWVGGPVGSRGSEAKRVQAKIIDITSKLLYIIKSIGDMHKNTKTLDNKNNCENK